jgi:hypothetical protein
MSGKKISIIIIAFVVAVGAFLFFRSAMNKKNQKAQLSVNAIVTGNSSGDEAASHRGDADEQNDDLADQDFDVQCQSGEWMKIADAQKETTTLEGKLRKVYPDDDLPAEFKAFSYYVEGKEKVALSGSDLSKLDNFEDRDIEVQGIKSVDGKSVAVSAARCAGVETDQASIKAKMSFMNWIVDNINAVASAKAPYRKWVVDTVEFVDDNNVYVEYYDAVENEEDFEGDDTSRKILLQVASKSDGGYGVKVLASWEMGEDDYELKSGSDKFASTTDTYYYQYDPVEVKWIRI